MSDIPYAYAIDSIMYAMLSTRPDVALTLSLMSRYQSNPGMSHWSVVKNIINNPGYSLSLSRKRIRA
jgi:hypothetical protein